MLTKYERKKGWRSSRVDSVVNREEWTNQSEGRSYYGVVLQWDQGSKPGQHHVHGSFSPTPLLFLFHDASPLYIASFSSLLCLSRCTYLACFQPPPPPHTRAKHHHGPLSLFPTVFLSGHRVGRGDSPSVGDKGPMKGNCRGQHRGISVYVLHLPEER